MPGEYRYRKLRYKVVTPKKLDAEENSAAVFQFCTAQNRFDFTPAPHTMRTDAVSTSVPYDGDNRFLQIPTPPSVIACETALDSFRQRMRLAET